MRMTSTNDAHRLGTRRRTLGKSVFPILLSLLFSPGTAWADWMLLLHEDASGKLGGNWEGRVEVEAKFRNNMSEFYDLEAMPWMACRVTEWFKLGFGWRELYSRRNTEIYGRKSEEGSDSPTYPKVAEHYWVVEHRPLVDFLFSAKAKSWTLEDRVRGEFRNIEGQDAFFRVRNRFRVRPPWAWTPAEIQPWAAWESYFEGNPALAWSDRFNRNRFFVGLGAKLSPRIKVGCYYYWEILLTPEELEYNHEIGLETGLVF